MSANAETVKGLSPARRIAYAGMVTALTLALLYLLAVVRNMTAAILFVLSLLPAILAHERRYADAALSFAASALLSGLLFFSMAPGEWVLFAAFFGWYAIFREFAVRRFTAAMRWLALELAFNVAFFAVYFFARNLFGIPANSIWHWLVVPAGELAFLLYENLFKICMDYYDKHLRKVIYRQ